MKSKISFLGVGINPINKQELFDYLVLPVSKVELVNCVNIHAFNILDNDEEFKEILNRTEILYCDGFGVKWSANLLGYKVGERMTPPDWIDDFFTVCETNNLSLFFVGDEKEVVTEFAKKVKSKYKDLIISGFHPGHLTQKSSKYLEKILVEVKPDIILTAMGMPVQEKWGDSMRKILTPCKIIATGALFRMYIGDYKRPASWITNRGFEWLARLIQEPRKVWRRYFIGLPKYVFQLLKHKEGPI